MTTPLCIEDRAAPVRRWGVVIPMTVAAVALSLGGCTVAALEVGSLVVTGISTGVSAIHDCHADGGCKELPLPP